MSSTHPYLNQLGTGVRIMAPGMPAPWVIPPESHRPARTCCRCGQTFSPEELRASGPGWSPLRDGWRCPNCTRAHEARIERLARRLIAEHEQDRWMHAGEHA